MDEKNVNLRDMELPYVFNEELENEKQIGFIILSSDQTLPIEMYELINVPGVAVYEAKQAVVPLPPLLTKEVLAHPAPQRRRSCAAVPPLPPPTVRARPQRR